MTIIFYIKKDTDQSDKDKSDLTEADWHLAVNVYEDNYKIAAELLGVNKNDVNRYIRKWNINY